MPAQLRKLEVPNRNAKLKCPWARSAKSINMNLGRAAEVYVVLYRYSLEEILER